MHLLTAAAAAALLLIAPAPAPQRVRGAHRLVACAAETDEREAEARAYELAVLRRDAEQWLAMCSAVSLTERRGAGLQPFSAPSGWMMEINARPSQAYTQDELIVELEAREPSLEVLLDACADRAPALAPTRLDAPRRPRQVQVTAGACTGALVSQCVRRLRPFSGCLR